MGKIEFDNCHIIGGLIEGGHWTGGFSSINSGYGTLTDGPVANETIFNGCSVEGVKILGSGSVGAFVGHCQMNPAGSTTFKNSKSINNILVTSHGNGYAGAVYAKDGAGKDWPKQSDIDEAGEKGKGYTAGQLKGGVHYDHSTMTVYGNTTIYGATVDFTTHSYTEGTGTNIGNRFWGTMKTGDVYVTPDNGGEEIQVRDDGKWVGDYNENSDLLKAEDDPAE